MHQGRWRCQEGSKEGTGGVSYISGVRSTVAGAPQGCWEALREDTEVEAMA